jgi:hypothetical protein
MPPPPPPPTSACGDYIAKRMRMSPIDQPLMLMELLGRQPARPRRRTWPGGSWEADGGPVLTGNGITRYGNGLYSLIGGEELSDAERDALLQLCRQRLDAFREQRGEEVFAHRSRHRSPISGSVKYRVLTRARGRCECCGARLLPSKPAPAGPGGGPHHPQKPGRLRRHQQPAGALLPLQRRQARRTCCRPTQEGLFAPGGQPRLLENELALCIATPTRCEAQLCDLRAGMG